MNNDYLLEWWMKNRFDRFCEYMGAWRDGALGVRDDTEDHSNEAVRIDRAISYVDMDDQHKNGGGIVKQVLLIKYGMEFIEYITQSYWEIRKSEL